MPNNEPAWTAFLDDLELRLGTYAATLVGCDGPPPLVMPEGIGPCPPQLRSRALTIVERQHDIENAIRARLSFLRATMEAEGSTQPQPSLYVDASA